MVLDPYTNNDELLARYSRPNGHDLAPAPRFEPAPEVQPVTIRLATMAEVVAHWEFIRTGLLWIKRRTQAANPEYPVLWEPQHIRREVEAGWAARARNEQATVELWMAYDAAGKPIAYTVSQNQGCPFTYTSLGLFVWIAYKDPADTSDVVARFDEFLSNVARSRGMEWLECATRRSGLLRRMKRHGWSENLVYLRKRVFPQMEER